MKDETMNYVNLTPHSLNIRLADGTMLDLAPSGTVARCQETRLAVEGIGDMPITLAQYGEVENLPNPAPMTCYIVSALVLAQVPERPDVFAPGRAIRDADGKVIGADGLSCTPSYVASKPKAKQTYQESQQDAKAAIAVFEKVKTYGQIWLEYKSKKARHIAAAGVQCSFNEKVFSSVDELLDALREIAPINKWSILYTPPMKPRLGMADERREMESRWE